MLRKRIPLQTACGASGLHGRLQAPILCYTRAPRGVAQLVARLVWDQEVESSNLSAPTSIVARIGGLKNFLAHLPLGGVALANTGRERPPRPSAAAPLDFTAMITVPVDWNSLTTRSDSLASPHTWLGLDPGVTEPAVIVQAARQRLEAIRDAYGSEGEVKDVLVSIIVTARQEMLSRVRVG